MDVLIFLPKFSINSRNIEKLYFDSPLKQHENNHKEQKSNECEVKSGKVIFFQLQIKANCNKNLLQNFSHKLRAIGSHA